MLASDIALRHGEGHHILKLITEAICSARLIECSTCPHPTGKCLVEQPAIHQDIHRPIGGGGLDGTEHVVPSPGDPFQDPVEVCGAIATDQLPRVFPALPLTQ